MPVTWSSPNWATVTSSASSTTLLVYPTTTWSTTGGTLMTYGVTTATTGTLNIWPDAYTLTGTPPVADAPPRQIAPPPELTPEERAARDAEIAARQQRAVQAAETRQAAQTRARDLLLAVLTEEQRAQYLRDETFEVIGSVGNRYRIRPGNAGNVHYLDPDTLEVAGRLCAHPSMREHWLPDQDVALAQLLALTSDEAGFVRLANVHGGIRPPLPELVAA